MSRDITDEQAERMHSLLHQLRGRHIEDWLTIAYLLAEQLVARVDEQGVADALADMMGDDEEPYF